MANKKCSYHIAYENQKQLVETRDKEIAALRAQLEQAQRERDGLIERHKTHARHGRAQRISVICGWQGPKT
jgi:hypothetical protein